MKDNPLDDVDSRGNRAYIHYDYVRKLAAQFYKLDLSDLYIALVLYELRSEFSKGVLYATKEEINDIYDNSFSVYMKDTNKNATMINPKYIDTINFLIEKKKSKKD